MPKPTIKFVALQYHHDADGEPYKATVVHEFTPNGQLVAEALVQCQEQGNRKGFDSLCEAFPTVAIILDTMSNLRASSGCDCEPCQRRRAEANAAMARAYRQ